MVIQTNALNKIYAANYDDSTCGAEMFMYLYKHQWFNRYSYVTMQLVDLCVYGEM